MIPQEFRDRMLSALQDDDDESDYMGEFPDEEDFDQYSDDEVMFGEAKN